MSNVDLFGSGEQAAIRYSIIDRIRAELNAGLKTHAQVVYFLVELRKLMEQLEHVHARTKFFLDWALHPIMSRQPALTMLKEIDHALDGCKAIGDLAPLLGARMSLDTFREDLIHELLRHHLPTDGIREMQPWLGFLRLYLQVIADCPILDYRARLRHIDRLAVRLDETAPSDLPKGAAFAFTIAWTFMKRREVVLQWNNEVVYPIDYEPGRFYQLHGPH